MTRRAWLMCLGLWSTWLFLAIWALWTLPQVPFHPDESSHLFLSQDFERLFGQGDPAGVTWQAAETTPALRRYRLLEAPLSRYLIGLGRALLGFGQQPLPADWDWSKTWAENGQLGALPGTRLLAAGRLPAAALTVLSILPLFAIGQRLGGPVTGIGASALYVLSGVIWLHGRRAMSEGPLLFCALLAFWIILRWAQRPALVGATVALAGAAKLTGLSVLPPAGVAVLLAPNLPGGHTPWRRRLGAVAVLAACFGLISWGLNPTLWADPLRGLSAMATARQTLLASQTAAMEAAGPSLVVATPERRALAMVYHTYWAPLAFWDVPNYSAETAAAEALYQQSWLNRGWRAETAAATLLSGTGVLALSLLGLVTGGRRWLRVIPQTDDGERKTLGLLGVWTLAAIGGLFPVTIAWQRYYLLLVPIACLWAGYGLAALAAPWIRRAGRANPASTLAAFRSDPHLRTGR